MERDQMMKHACKLCDKRFPCGRSLGGHMRSHVIVNSAEEVEDKPNMEMGSSNLTGGRISKLGEIIEANEQSGYGLRNNPKKTWRFVDSSNGGEQQERICKECGKGFQSLKALCGHMACHSERGRVLNNVEDHSWISANQKPVMDSQSDTESIGPKQQRRSKRLRYKTSLAVNCNSPTFSVANGSSSVSEIEQEQEEIAMCLMMLSRDSGNWGGLNSVVDSSDNNSVVLEARSLSIDMRIGKKKEVLNYHVFNGDEIVEMKKLRNRKLKSGGAFDAESVYYLENSDSGYLANGAKKVESDAYVGGIYRNGEFKKLEVEGGSRFKVSNGELGMGTKRLKCEKSEFLKDLIKEEGYDPNRALMKRGSRKSAKNDSQNSEIWGISSANNTVANGVEACKKAQKRSKFECSTCNKVFHSHQALGGHIASHNKINGFSASAYESGENSVDTNPRPDNKAQYKQHNFCSDRVTIDHQEVSGTVDRSSVSKKGKRYECPICFKVFRSGQALGGHKRIHLVGNGGSSEVKGNGSLEIKEEQPHVPDLIDLNLPAPIED